MVDEDRSPALGAAGRRTLRPPFFQPPVQIGVDDIDAAMDAGTYTFVLDIPPRFQADAGRGPPPRGAGERGRHRHGQGRQRRPLSGAGARRGGPLFYLQG